MFKRTQPDVYSVQYLVARKQDSGIASSRQKLLWLIVGALLLISIVTISIVLGVVYARWEDHALFEDKQEGSSEDGYPDDTPIKAALQHDALQKDRQMQSINPTAVSPFAPSQDDQVLKPTDVHLHPVITPKRVSLGQFENEVEEVDVLEMTMSLPASVDVTSQEFEHEVAKALRISFQAAEQRHTESQARRKRETFDPSSVTVNITNVTALDDGTVVVDFFIVENGKVVGTAVAVQIFNRLSLQELEDTILAEVFSLIAVSASSIIFVGRTELPSLSTLILESSTEPVDSMLTSLGTIETSSIVLPISSPTSGEITPSTMTPSNIQSSQVLPDSSLGSHGSSVTASLDSSILQTSGVLPVSPGNSTLSVVPDSSPGSRGSSATASLDSSILQTSGVLPVSPGDSTLSVVPDSSPGSRGSSVTASLDSSILQTSGVLTVSSGDITLSVVPDSSLGSHGSSVTASLDSSILQTSGVLPVSPGDSTLSVVPDSSPGSHGSSVTASLDSSILQTSGVLPVSPGESTLSVVPDSSTGSHGSSVTASLDNSILRTSGVLTVSSGESTLSVVPDSSPGSHGSSVIASLDISILQTSGVLTVSPGDNTLSVVPDSSPGSHGSSVTASLDSSILQTSGVLTVSPGESTLSVLPDSSPGSHGSSVTASLDSSILQTSGVLPVSSGDSTLSVVPDSSPGSHGSSVTASLDSSILQTSGVLTVSPGDSTLSVVPDSSPGSRGSSATASLDSSILQTSGVLPVSPGDRTLSVVPDSSPGSHGSSVTASLDSSMHQTSGVLPVSSGEIIISPSSPSLSVQSSSVLVTPNEDQLVRIEIGLPRNFSSAADPRLSSYLQEKLTEIYNTGKARLGNRRKRATSNAEVQVTDIKEQPSGGLAVEFYVVEDGKVVSAETVMAAFAQLTPQEQNEILGAEVLSLQIPINSSQASSHLRGSATPDSSVSPTSVVLSPSPGEITPSLSSQLMPSSSQILSTSDVPVQSDSYSLASSHRVPVQSSASPSIAPTKPLSSSSVVMTSSATTPVPPESNLLRITFKLNEFEDVNSEEFQKRIAEALRQAYIKGRQNQQSHGRRKRETAEVDSPRILIHRIFKEDNNGVVHFQVADIDSALSAQDILNTFEAVGFEQLKAMLCLELLPPGVKLVCEDVTVCRTVTAPSTLITPAVAATSLPPTLLSPVLLSSSAVMSTATLASFTCFLFLSPSSTLGTTSSAEHPASLEMFRSSYQVLTNSPVIISSTVLSESAITETSFLSSTSVFISSSSFVIMPSSASKGSGSSTFDASPATSQPSYSTSSIYPIYSSLSSTARYTSLPDSDFSETIPSIGNPNLSYASLSTTLESSVLASSSEAPRPTTIFPSITISEISLSPSTAFYTDSFITESFQTTKIISLGTAHSIITFLPTIVDSSSFPSSIVIKSTDFSGTVSSTFFSSRDTVSASSESMFTIPFLDTTSVKSTSGSVTDFPVTSSLLPRTTSYLTSTSLWLQTSTVSLKPTMDLPSSFLITTTTSVMTRTVSIMPSPSADTPITPTMSVMTASSLTSVESTTLVESTPSTVTPVTLTTLILPTSSTVTPVTSTTLPLPTSTVTPVTLAPTSAPPTSHSLSRLTIQVKTVVNVNSELFKAFIQPGLEKCYVEALFFGQIRRKRREVFGTASGNYTLIAQVTDVNREPESPRKVHVDFYVTVDGEELSAEQVSSTLNRLTPAELSAITRYPVLEPVRPVTADTVPSTDEDPNNDLGVILAIVIPSVLVIIVIILFLVWYCRNNEIRTGTSLAKDPETLGHHNLDVDIERGDIVKKSMTWKSTSSGSLTLKKKSTPLAIEVEEPIESTPHRALQGSVPPLSRSTSFEPYFPNPESKDRRNNGYLYEDDWLNARDRRGREESHYERAEFDSRESLDPCYSPISEESIARSYIPTPVSEMEEEPVVQYYPTTFANVAKMSRIAMADEMFAASPPDVKYRTVASDSQGVDDLSGSILEDRGVIERYRNKQRQRERIRQLEEEKLKSIPPATDTQLEKEDAYSGAPVIQREIGTQSQSLAPVSPAEHDDHDGGERTKLGRNMRARPRRPDKRGAEQNEPLQQPLLNPDADSASPLETLYFSPSLHPAYSTPSGQVVAPQTNPLIESPQHPTQDLLETLNRQQQLVSNPVREPSPSPDMEDAKRRAQQLINDSFLLEQIQEHRRKQEQMEEMNQLLSDAFPLANSGIINGDIEVTNIANGTVTPNDSEQLQFHKLHLNGGDSLEMETETDSPLMSGQERSITSTSFVPESSVQSPLRHNQMNGYVPTGFDPHDMNPRLRKAIRGELRKPQPTKL